MHQPKVPPPPPLPRAMEDPRQFASILMRRLGHSNNKAFFREAEDLFLDAMNEALNHARLAVAQNPKWAAEAIEALRVQLNNPKE